MLLAEHWLNQNEELLAATAGRAVTVQLKTKMAAPLEAGVAATASMDRNRKSNGKEFVALF